jgi:hypothetical protein
MISIQKVTSNVQSVQRQSADIYSTVHIPNVFCDDQLRGDFCVIFDHSVEEKIFPPAGI